jgi:Rrf2 family protein
MLQRTAEYALRVAIALARDPAGPSTSGQIAKATRVPPRYLYKVLQSLTRAGLVRSQPGPGGGYMLAADPDATTLLEVVAAIEPVTRIRSCPVGLKTHSDLCPLHQRLDQAYAAIEEALRGVTLGEVLRAPGRIRPLVEVPSP